MNGSLFLDDKIHSERSFGEVAEKLPGKFGEIFRDLPRFGEGEH